jgi:hypothetical protein
MSKTTKTTTTTTTTKAPAFVYAMKDESTKIVSVIVPSITVTDEGLSFDAVLYTRHNGGKAKTVDTVLNGAITSALQEHLDNSGIKEDKGLKKITVNCSAGGVTPSPVKKLLNAVEEDEKAFTDEEELSTLIHTTVGKAKSFAFSGNAVVGAATGKKITEELLKWVVEKEIMEGAIKANEEAKAEKLKKISGGKPLGLEEKEEKELKSLVSSELGFKTMKYIFKKHILIEGEKGSGKTYTVSRLLHLLKVNQVFTAGHESMESIDLLGHLIPASDGTLVWKDGPLTQAFRMAQEVPTALFFDEILRVPQRELNILVGSLSPNAQGLYVLRTGRVVGVTEDGVAIEETIEVPQDRLWVVGTTNVGAGYGVDDIEEALADRFRLVRKDTSEEEAKLILTNNAKSVGFTGSDLSDTVTKMMKFFALMKELQKSGEINKIINQRHMSESILLSEGSVATVKQNLADLVLNWIDRDTNGYPMKEQQALVMKTISKVFT